MQNDKGRSSRCNEKNEIKKEGNKKEDKKKVKEEQPLKFFVQIGDCTPQIYTISITFNPSMDYASLNFDEKFLRGLVEETNAVLVPVLEKYTDKLKKLQG